MLHDARTSAMRKLQRGAERTDKCLLWADSNIHARNIKLNINTKFASLATLLDIPPDRPLYFGPLPHAVGHKLADLVIVADNHGECAAPAIASFAFAVDDFGVSRMYVFQEVRAVSVANDSWQCVNSGG